MRIAVGRKSALPAKLLPSVEVFQEKLETLNTDQGGRLTVEKETTADLRKTRKAAVRRSTADRFGFRGEEGSLSFYL